MKAVGFQMSLEGILDQFKATNVTNAILTLYENSSWSNIPNNSIGFTVSHKKILSHHHHDHVIISLANCEEHLLSKRSWFLSCVGADNHFTTVLISL